MSVAECYDLSVQCDNNAAHILPMRSDFTGRNQREARAAMRRAGWKLGPNFTAYCPKCKPPRPHGVKESSNG